MSSKDYFDGMAARWDSIMGPEVAAKLQAILQGCGIPKGATVLDVACGTGILTPILLELVGQDGSVTGVDFAPQMIERARSKNFSSNARFLVADIMALDDEDNSYDYVICNGALPHFPDIKGALRIMHRVLRNDGRLIICHADSREEINATHRRIGPPVADDLLPTAAELKYMLEDTGFIDISFADKPDRFVFLALKHITSTARA
ncbi:Ubiquinone/menaquinone biosynthesis C-methylase UbiE [Desulfotomaculum arcticum]|uniref:Ubiquinone/menaquinone biosynthesis C-methylase UbiE n=1 Tax=Desulfotruncus arcticus DSM 17038 TaxID=1121424 RepID=A0A1I2SXT8_9FIRM|nr:class I SAM-dependent methyltransferase [Desulfotruncus arcticus]SFG57410.1 Ubiquinone/menaquinone biosynthesis C-methylase UbiE [Desulfotomaculum arcticum] [Desulfotruncus arcticus DSM 17038]